MPKRELPSLIAEQLGYDPMALTKDQREAVEMAVSHLLRWVAEGLAEGWKLALVKGDPVMPVPSDIRVLNITELSEGEEPRSELLDWLASFGAQESGIGES